MTTKRSNKCRICGDLFVADPRNRKRQKYCPKPACKAAGKAARQRRWLAQGPNRDYFRGPDQVQRVREWRAVHPSIRAIGEDIGAKGKVRYKTH